MELKEQIAALDIHLDKPTINYFLVCERVPPPIIPLFTDILKVHVIPHSHMDVVWLDDFSESYEKHVRSIYSNVVASLTDN